MVEIYTHLDISTPKDVYDRISYLKWIFKNTVHTKFELVIRQFNNYLSEGAWYSWNIGSVVSAKKDDF